LVNILAGKKIVPEFIQRDANPKNIASSALSLLKESTKREKMTEELFLIKKMLGEKGASKKVAKIAYDLLHQC